MGSDDAQYPSKATLVLPDYFVGMTIRLFVYKRDDEGQATINVEYYKALRYWNALVEYRDHRFRFYSKSGGTGNTSYEINDVPESKFYILGIKCKDQANFEAYVNEMPVGSVNVSQILNYTWTLYLTASGQYMISFHMINEDGAVPNGYWGRSSYFRNYWLPIGTIGILTCDIVDNSKENWMDHWVGPRDNDSKRFKFNHGSLKKDTRVYYTIKLYTSAFAFSCSFENTIYVEPTNNPHYIQPYFSEALNIENFDLVEWDI
nr:uncharacterized protein LOC119184757 [Rhipicephalus microplus]